LAMVFFRPVSIIEQTEHADTLRADQRIRRFVRNST